MAVSYLAGNRATGTASERTGLIVYSAKSWVELGRATLSSAGDTLDLTGLDTSDYPHIKILATVQPSTGGSDETYLNWRFNNDSGNNYAFRYNSDGGSDGTNTSQNKMLSYPPTNNQWQFITMDLLNKSDQEKLAVLHTVCRGATAGGGSNEPRRREVVGKWANTSSTITQVTAVNSQTSQGDFQVGTEFVVLGAKSSGTITDKGGFWQELADVELSSNGTLTSGTFAAKKYLHIQLYAKNTASDTLTLKFNDSTSTDYANYRNRNGTFTDPIRTSKEAVYVGSTNDTDWWFFDIYIINKSDKEKLVISQGSSDGGGTGASTTPNREESFGKWANTSAQITKIDIEDDGGNFNTLTSGSRIKVWGSD